MPNGIRVLFTIPSSQAHDRSQPHSRITAIGGRLCHQPWTLSQTDAISAIDRNQLRFWASVRGQRAKVVVAESMGHRYLKTELDGEQPESLVQLADARAYYQADGG